MAREANLDELLKKEKSLYLLIQAKYEKRMNVSKELIQLQKIDSELNAIKFNKEITDLLAYLDLCFHELKKVVRTPYSLQNAEIISDLGIAVDEGSRQIMRLSRTSVASN